MKPGPISVDSAVSSGNDTAEVAVPGPRTPSQIGPYKILRLIGRGGMGTVYRAQVVVSCQVPIGQEVALKLLRETDDKERKRFAREATYLQALHHPGIVRVLDNGEYEGQPYIVMQLVEGKHADDLLIPGKPVDQQLIADIGVQALEALHVAHMHGILHRDIKPGNIMIGSNGQVKLVDFGLAQYMDMGESHLTATGAVVGTPAYMSPEQASGRREEISRRSDVFSMGACLYELVTGQQPFTADNSVALLRCIIEENLVPPSTYRKDIDRDLETVILKAMAKDWRDRYPSAEAMAADLRRFRLGVRIRTARPNFMRPLLRAAWHQRASLSMVALIVFVAASSAMLIVRSALKRAERAGAESVAAGSTLITNSPNDVSSSGTNTPPPPIPENPWVETFVQTIPFEDPMSPFELKDVSEINKGYKRISLPAVSGSVRLSTTLELLDVTYTAEIMVSSRQFGEGYCVRLVGTRDSDQLELLRDKRVIRSKPLGQLVRPGPHTLTIQRDDDKISVIFNSPTSRTELEFQDLIPIEGIYADGVHLAFTIDQVKFTQTVLERQKSTLYVSALARADSMRQSELYSRAIEEYENFIKDHPDAPEVPAAQLRIALCLEGEAKDEKDEELVKLKIEEALAKFNEVASVYRDNSKYVLAATFHAWNCALRLERMQEAEEYFEAIRRNYEVPDLLSIISEDTVKDLLTTYRKRADILTMTDSDRAIRLFGVVAEIASYLNRPKDMANAQERAAELLLMQNRYREALTSLRAVIVHDRVDELTRTRFRLHSAEVERLRNQFDAAEKKYLDIINQAVPQGDTADWARLWLGDLYIQRNEVEKAMSCWAEANQTKSLPSKLMEHLRTSEKPFPINKKTKSVAEILYFNARSALLRGQYDEYRNLLHQVIEQGPMYRWTALIAERQLEQLDFGIPIENNPEPDDE